MQKIVPKKKEYYDSQMSGKYVKFIEYHEDQIKESERSDTDCGVQVIEATTIGPDLICDIVPLENNYSAEKDMKHMLTAE